VLKIHYTSEIDLVEFDLDLEVLTPQASEVVLLFND
jgi:hypothetical protein